MGDNQYIYAVARIRTKELTLFSKQVIDQLMACKTYNDVLRLLTDKGWDCEGKSPEEFLAAEREKTWDLMRELVDDMSVFNVFLYANDFHNLKAAIKQVCVVDDVPNVFMRNATVGEDLCMKAVKEKDFSILPENMREAAAEAYEVQLKERGSQMCDVIVDRAALEAIYKAGKESKNPLFEGYAELKCVAADINTAIRGCKAGKSLEFFKRAFAPCDTLDLKALTDAALSGIDAVYDYLQTTQYADAVPAIKESLSSFEKWCDDRMMAHIRPEKYNPFTIAPLAAYILARENEIKSVRIILSGKLNDLPEDTIRERLREMYV
ncbi:MAG: V-type ATPase subunit [Lachnospiraceae bacterium]|nr:V-type ATPase subunit [Lachnospiraceae bacterium]